MGKPYSMGLRERLVAYVEAGHSCRAAARLLRVSARTAVRLAAAHRERSDVRPKPKGRAPGSVGKLAGHQAFLLKIVGAEPDITLKELAGALAEAHGVRVRLSSLHRASTPRKCGPAKASFTRSWLSTAHPSSRSPATM